MNIMGDCIIGTSFYMTQFSLSAPNQGGDYNEDKYGVSTTDVDK